MKETKQAAAAEAARGPWHEVMAAFEAFKAANDQRIGELERGRSEPLLEEKVARIDASLQAAERRLERVVSESRRPFVGGDAPPIRRLAPPSPQGGRRG